MSSVSNILLDPNSHEAHQRVRNSQNQPVGYSRSSSAILQSSNRDSTNDIVKSNKETVRILGAGTCRRGKELTGSHLESNRSPSDIRHHLFTEVMNFGDNLALNISV